MLTFVFIQSQDRTKTKFLNAEIQIYLTIFPKLKDKKNKIRYALAV